MLTAAIKHATQTSPHLNLLNVAAAPIQLRIIFVGLRANHGLKSDFLSPNTYLDCIDCVYLRLSLLAPGPSSRAHKYKYSTLNLSQMGSKKVERKRK